MTRALVTLDRLVGILVGLVLVVLGLLLVEWKLGLLLSLPAVAHPDRVTKTVALPWWPLAAAVIAVVLVLLGLRWLLAHLPRVRSSDARLSGSSAQGRLRLDTPSVAHASADALQADMVLPDARGKVREVRGRALVQLDAHCARETDVRDVRDRAETVARDVALAFPSGDVPLRIIVNAPRTRVRDRARPSRARVQEAPAG